MAETTEIIKILRGGFSEGLLYFKKLSAKKQSVVLLQLSAWLQKDFVFKLNDDEMVTLIHHLDPDKTADILQLMPARRQKKILERLKEDMRNKVSMLLRFDAQTAGGLVSLNYIQVDLEGKVAEVMVKIKVHEKNTGKFPVVLAMNEGRLVGALPSDALMLAKSSDKVRGLVKRVVKIRHSMGYKKIVSVFRSNLHKKLVVLNDDGSILGVIYSDDVLRLLHENEGRNLYDFAGVSREETVLDSVSTKIGFRYRWLILNLGTAFLAALIVSLFKGTIEKYVLLAVYMPIVAGMGGNAATQTLAVMVRGLALKQVSLNTAMPVVLKEVEAGFVNGVLNGLIVALVSWWWVGEPLLGLVFGVAIVATLMVAGFFGALIPLLMQKLDRDPATSATIFITTATDVFGFFIFLGLASLVL